MRRIAFSRWHASVNAVHAGQPMRDWLIDSCSLTSKLIAVCPDFRVKRIRQGRNLCIADELAAIGLHRRRQVIEREVLLECGGVPVVYAHTIVPLGATASDWPFFGMLGDKSLGSALFCDPKIVRGALHFARLQPDHPLARRACRALGLKMFAAPLFARRCLYRRNSGLLLVTEVFLPAIVQAGSGIGAALHVKRFE